MDQDPTKKHCSFCGAQGSYDPPLFGGLGGFICGDCVVDFAAMVESARGRAHESLPWDSMSDPQLLGQLWLIAKTAMQAQDFLTEWVQLLRSRGTSWTEIGQALGISRQRAMARFAPQA
ncbi:ClpX C4-type zinc finger protein [Nocardioides sp. CN2-186]|uniref:ClpX C4-type zinc finger protein n=1 Tax=Nocardioides tweenelious TaxID=3156607 RepID=UPI0032B3B6DA